MGLTSRSDAELIESILASNTSDFEILMSRYQQRIFSYLYRFLYQNKEAALDLTQDVFIKVFENLGSVDTSRPIQSWIYRIAHNEAANYLRSVSRKKESKLEEDQWDDLPASANSDQLEEEETRQQVLNALEQIDPKYREVLVLYFFEERSYKEIAEILNSSTNSVGTLISRGKKQMEDRLKGILDYKTQLAHRVFTLFIIGFFIRIPAAVSGDWS